MPERRTKIPWWGKPGSIPLYPFLVGLFPVSSLAAYNISQADLSLTYRSFLISLVLTILLFGLLRLALHEWSRAAFLVACLLVLFFSYGQVYTLLLNLHIFKAGLAGHIQAGHAVLLPVWLGLAALAIWFTVRGSIDLAAASPFLTLISAVLLIYPLFQISRFEIMHRAQGRTQPGGATAPVASRPDIYYIILDAYERADTLKLVYDYDNSDFLTELNGRGFYIANCSQSNYAYTQSSLASSLNLETLDSLSVTSNAQADPLVQENTVRRFLKAQGYKIVAFETGFRWTQWEDADVYYHYRYDARYLNEFEALFLRTTIMRLPLDVMDSEQAGTYGVIAHNRVLYVLDTLKALPAQVGSPKFVFVHLTIPHPPFVFGPEGQFVTAGAENATSLTGYRNSVSFINGQILQVVDRLIADSSVPPIIVIQGDHGAPLYHTPLQRMTILNAYYLPGGASHLYPSISPVNTFRLIFDTYFGQHYGLLDDVSYYSSPNQEYEFGAIPNQCNK